MMEIKARHWLIAVLIAGLAHAALAFALVHHSVPLPAGAPGINIELGDGGDAGSAGSTAAEALQPVASPGGVTGAAKQPPSPEAENRALLLEPLSGDQATEQVSDRVEPLEPETAILAKALPEPKPEPVPKTAPHPEPKRSPPPTPARTEPAPKAQPSRPRASASEAPSRASARPGSDRGDAGGSPEAERSAQVRGGREGSTDSGRVGSGHAASGNAGAGDSGSGGKHNDASASNYYGRLATWLARHKRYPVQARRLRQEGLVKVTFTIDSDGRVVSKRIAQSSGHELLDREVQAMLDRASPLPRIPPSLGRTSITITLPVAFNLR